MYYDTIIFIFIIYFIAWITLYLFIAGVFILIIEDYYQNTNKHFTKRHKIQARVLALFWPVLVVFIVIVSFVRLLLQI